MVGAGVAGLTAADALRCAGVEVVVLEARDRIGGRTWTVPLGDGRLDLGAAWVHGPVGNPVAEAIANAGLGTRNDGAFFSRMELWDGEWLDAAAATALTTAIEADWEPGEPLAVAPESDRFLDGVEWFLNDRELEGRARELARFGIESILGALYVGAPAERISLAGAAAYEDGGGGNLVPVGGYRTLVERLASGLDVRLGSPVTSIEHGADGVVVGTANGEAVEAERAIVTVPLGVLKAGSIRFDPPLGPEQAGAAQRLAMASLEKVAFRFDERFWPDSAWQLTRLDEDRAFPVWLDFSRHTGSPTLVGFHNPEAAPVIAGASPGERAAAGLAALREMFGSVPDPEQTLVTDWLGDPHALGSYSYIPLGASTEDMHSLARPVSDRLALAGEATVPHAYGTVHAAFESGLRAAALALGERPERLSLGPVPARWLPPERE